MPKPDSPIVSIDWLAEHAGDADFVIADVRPREEYRAGHIPGAIHADLSALRLTSSDPDTVAAWTGRLHEFVNAHGMGSGKTVVFYEQVSGTVAAYGVWLLDAAGQGNGAMLDGGIAAWHNASQQLSNDDVQPSPTSAAIQPNDAVLATAGGILSSLSGNAPGSQLVDARAAHEYGMGSIPGAINVDWSQHLNPDGTFKPAPELESLYADLDKAEPVASYCAGGIRAANTYVVLKALGFASAQNYAPSWGEWGNLPDTPVEGH